MSLGTKTNSTIIDYTSLRIFDNFLSNTISLFSLEKYILFNKKKIILSDDYKNYQLIDNSDPK